MIEAKKIAFRAQMEQANIQGMVDDQLQAIEALPPEYPNYSYFVKLEQLEAIQQLYAEIEEIAKRVE
tara:strand:+ start:115 stop:315 length:201 start_codon:yes stop_codon:yes gene_type:complete